MPEADKSSRSFTLRQTTHIVAPPAGGLYLVSTPIGNLGDITIRALETLAGCDLIACEDTRTSGVLLSRYGIHRPKTSYNEHNAADKGALLMQRLNRGEAVALISDAGTPLMSDPGARLVVSAVEAGVPVIPVPGASAPLAALVASGLPADGFTFAGFLPVKTEARRRRLETFADCRTTLVFFESPKRIAASLADMAAVFGGDRQAVIARELTKMHESFYRGELAELRERFSGQPPKGEIVVLIAPAEQRRVDIGSVEAELKALIKTMPTGKAAARLAAETGISRRELYQYALKLKNDDE